MPIDAFFGWGIASDYSLSLLVLMVIFGIMLVLAAFVFMVQIKSDTPLLSANHEGVTVAHKVNEQRFFAWEDIQDIMIVHIRGNYFIFIQLLRAGSGRTWRTEAEVTEMSVSSVSKDDAMIQPVGYSKKEIKRITQQIIKMWNYYSPILY